jgi:competence protein ComEA
VDRGDGRLGEVDLGDSGLGEVDRGDGRLGQVDLGDSGLGEVDRGDGRLRAADRGDGRSAEGDWRERAGLALRERMPLWLQTRCGLERRNVLALTVVLVVAAAFAVQHFWAGRTQPVRPPEVVRAAAPYGAEPGQADRSGDDPGAGAQAAAGAARTAAAAGAAGTAGASGAAEIVVDVGGKVRDPGIHRLPAGSRVADALRAAGGVKPGTDTDGLNRARFLVDGEQVIVGGPAPVAGAAAGGQGGAAGTAPAGPAGGVAGGGLPAAPVSLNTATLDQLDTLPGVGPVLAQHIVDYRTQHGGFRSVDELREVNGIGDRRFADLRNLVRP